MRINEIIKAVQDLARERDEAQDAIANLKRAFTGWAEAFVAREKLDAVDEYFQEQQSPIALLNLLLVLYGAGPEPRHLKNTTPTGLGRECGLGLRTAYEPYAYWYCPCHGQVGDKITAETIIGRIRQTG
ncbi:hypothetical protein LCGC14_2574150 [marine sediment metagenome]|uniref:Uncharacterized protein n=1 Tax=marine sediment metagenome TaxID=412755 RepID=A0A0F9B486_9ZZZZ